MRSATPNGMTGRRSSSCMASSVALGIRLMHNCNVQTTSFSMWETRIPPTTFIACTVRGISDGYPQRARLQPVTARSSCWTCRPPRETITLGDLKRRITEVTAELNGGDGSEEYRECVSFKYRYIRNQRNWPEERGNPYGVWDLNYSLVSGQPAGTVLDQAHAFGVYPDSKVIIWVEGRDSALFDTTDGNTTASDTDGDGEYDTIEYDLMVTLARPVPAGEYRFVLKENEIAFKLCDFVISNEWTVTVTAPEGVLHEAFFRPRG